VELPHLIKEITLDDCANKSLYEEEIKGKCYFSRKIASRIFQDTVGKF
jgi:hypothetical protein